MRNAWLIRPVPHGIPRVTEFKEKGIIAVGWPCIGNLKGKSREDLKHLLSLPPYSLTGLALGNAYATIDIFVNQMEVGDLLLMPNGEDIYLGEVTSDYYLDAAVDSNEEGYPTRERQNGSPIPPEKICLWNCVHHLRFTERQQIYHII